MNKITVKVGIVVIAAGAVLAGLGLLQWISYENCLELIRAFDRGESGMTPICPADPAGRFFLAALPVGMIGIVILVLGIKNIPLLPSPKPPPG